jgi:hypothetical protein
MRIGHLFSRVGFIKLAAVAPAGAM